MSIEKEQKSKIIKDYGNTDKDTGSIEVQVAVLTERIKVVTEHCKKNSKDFSSRRGLLMLVAKRKRLLSYLKKKFIDRYNNLVKKLGLKDNN